MTRSIYLVDLKPVMGFVKKPEHVDEEVWMKAWENWLCEGGLFHYGGLCVKTEEVVLHPDWSYCEYSQLWESRITIAAQVSQVPDIRFFYQRFIIERELGRECTFELDKSIQAAIIVFE